MDIKRMFRSIRFFLFFDQLKRGNYARKKKIFHHVGKNVRLPAMLVPLHSELISFGNNVEVASGVKFVVHDAIHGVLNFKYHGEKNNSEFKEQLGCIDIQDNVFIGSGTIVLGNVRIGSDTVIGANSLINKDIPAGAVWAGIPAKQIDTFENFAEKRRSLIYLETAEERWKVFDERRRHKDKSDY
jgi:acetyltransferase-like isoleucine patch superfamily enzyme